MITGTRIFKELPCFGVKFSNMHPAMGVLLSSRDIFGGEAKSVVMQISFVMLIFLLFSNHFLGGRQIAGQIA